MRFQIITPSFLGIGVHNILSAREGNAYSNKERISQEITIKKQPEVTGNASSIKCEVIGDAKIYCQGITAILNCHDHSSGNKVR